MSQVSFSEYCQDPVSLLKNPNLVVRVGGKYYNWQVAAPMVMSAIVYLQVLPSNTRSQLCKNYMPKKVWKYKRIYLVCSTLMCVCALRFSSFHYRPVSHSGPSGGVVEAETMVWMAVMER